MQWNEIFEHINVLDWIEEYGWQRTNKSGHKFICLCPLHEEKRPSFYIDLNTGIWNCFSSCGGGSFLKLIQKLEDFQNYNETINFILEKLKIKEKPKNLFTQTFFLKDKLEKKIKIPEEDEISEEEFKMILRDICFHSESLENYQNPCAKRVSWETAKKWNMLYCNDKTFYYYGRLLIPIIYKEELVTYAARDMLGISKKKYLYPKGTKLSEIFFNWDECIGKENIIFCEGVLSTIKLINWGYNAIGIFSCHLSLYKQKLIEKTFWKTKIFICLDNDDKPTNPGQTSAKKIIDKLKGKMNVYNIVLPIGKDPDDCNKEEFEKSFEESRNQWKNLKIYI